MYHCHYIVHIDLIIISHTLDLEPKWHGGHSTRGLRSCGVKALPNQPYTRSPSQDFRLFGPRPWKVLAATYEKKRFLSNPDPGENLVRGNLVMETGCT